MKFSFTFEYPIPNSGRYRSNLSGFFVPFSFNDTSGKTRCRSSRNCLNTIALFGLDNGNNGTVFCRFNALNYPKEQMQNLLNFKVSELSVRYVPRKLKGSVINHSFDAYKICMAHWDKELITIQEQFAVMLLNRANEVIGFRVIGMGNGNSCITDIRLIASLVCTTLASSVILVHNHPSGKVNPSLADKRVTRKVADALALFDVAVQDHIILGKTNYLSFIDNSIKY
ncbi:MAG: JAB domain-containing protein [Leadbetterella sp.]